MGGQLRRLAVLLLGAVLLGTVGLSLGSWAGGRGHTPPTDDQARVLAGELLPTTSPVNSARVVPGSRWGVALAADDLGSGRVSFWYASDADCALSAQLRHNAAAQGWHDISRTTGYLCDDWRAERDGLTVTLEHSPTGANLIVAPSAPDRFVVVTVAGTLLGAAAGAALFWLLARRRPPVPLVVGTLVTVGLLPGVALTWLTLQGPNLRTEPVWPLWPALAPLLVPLWLVLLPLGVWALRTPAARGNDNRTVAVVAVSWVLGSLAAIAALLLLFALAQPTRP
ncbi:hypothetical protein [Micromonospora sp. NPDC005220]|uniref:hypothetical protein n=1 Tax=Micromonospora sp. NPDC005220 TaxID=3155589 RepID=UPI0033AAF12C